MRKKILQIALLCFAVGVLLSGVGLGIGMVEWTSLRYIGEKTIGDESRTKAYEETVTTEHGNEVFLMIGEDYEVKPDALVPQGVIRYQITYNSQVCDPQLKSFHGLDHEEYSILLRWKDSFGVVMQCKDEILKDIKNRQIASYQVDDDLKVVISYHPAMEELYEMKIVQQ